MDNIVVKIHGLRMRSRDEENLFIVSGYVGNEDLYDYFPNLCDKLFRFDDIEEIITKIASENKHLNFDIDLNAVEQDEYGDWDIIKTNEHWKLAI